MARLNEGPDSFEALKRRFIRQNREIAKVNSQQSQRIRNLEIEISRLLAENISIREQAIAIQNEAAQSRGTQKLARDVQALKARMVQKLAEVTGIVEELDVVSAKTRRRSAFSRNNGYLNDLAASPDEEKEDWTTKRPVREIQEPTMPPILEGKTYPRRTLEKDAAILRPSDGLGPAGDAKRLSDSQFDPANNTTLDPVHSGSDLASSAISDAVLDGHEYAESKVRGVTKPKNLHLEHEEAGEKYERRTSAVLRRRSSGFSSDDERSRIIKSDTGQSNLTHSRDNLAPSRLFLELAQEAHQPPQISSTLSTDSTQEPSVSAQVNVETRRKRRTSALIQPATDLEDSQRPAGALQAHAANPPEIAGPVPKAGAKRRLSMSELHDSSFNKGVSKELDDFIYQRKQASATTAAKPSRFTARPPTTGKDQESNTSHTTQPQLNPTTTTRKILAPKSINSPSKKKISTIKSKVQDSQAPDADMKEPRPASRTINRADLQKNAQNGAPAYAYSKPSLQSSRNGTMSKDKSISLGSVDKLHSLVTDGASPDTDTAPPKTPAVELAADLFSPPDSAAEPSNVRKVQELAQTNNSVEDVLNGSIGRGSRRARAAVSYAEPNLRDKMRRDGARVSAVDGEVSRRRSTAI